MGQVQSAIFASAVNQLFWGHSCAVSLETKKKRENHRLDCWWLFLLLFIWLLLLPVKGEFGIEGRGRGSGKGAATLRGGANNCAG